MQSVSKTWVRMAVSVALAGVAAGLVGCQPPAAGEGTDAGGCAAVTPDAGNGHGNGADAGNEADAGSEPDAGSEADAGTAPDAGTPDAGTPDAGTPCSGMGCRVVDCAAQQKPATSLSGTVYAPNGTLPLYGVTVFVPVNALQPLQTGAQCSHCGAAIPEGAYAQAVTDANGHFTLTNVPATHDVPLVMQVGKWRKQVILANVDACRDTAVPANLSTLPKSRAEGDLPQIAITTGSADALDCLVRKIGIADSEITTDSQGGRVHLFNGNGAKQFAAGFPGGTGSMSSATTLWADLARLKSYDVVLMSCEGGQNPLTKPQASMQALHDYADQGGRVLMSHWHNIWIGGDMNDPTHNLADWKQTATFDFAAAQPALGSTQKTLVDETSARGHALADWLLTVGASSTRDHLDVTDTRYTCKAVAPGKAEQWIYVDPANPLIPNLTGVQDMVFSTPLSAAAADRCGKVNFTDMHVSSDSSSKSTTPYPGGCSTQPLTPQEKALAFIFFDLSSCVGGP